MEVWWGFGLRFGLGLGEQGLVEVVECGGLGLVFLVFVFVGKGRESGDGDVVGSLVRGTVVAGRWRGHGQTC